jgi:hypothetical protein
LLVLSLALFFYFLFISPLQTYAQETTVSPTPKTDQISTIARPETEHRFWDSTNIWLFSGVGASRALDYSSTLNMRRRGRQEILLNNDVVDNHAAFAAIEAAGTAVSIGAAYVFHRTGHHKLERWTSIIHISATTVGAVHNYSLNRTSSASYHSLASFAARLLSHLDFAHLIERAFELALAARITKVAGHSYVLHTRGAFWSWRLWPQGLNRLKKRGIV